MNDWFWITNDYLSMVLCWAYEPFRNFSYYGLKSLKWDFLGAFLKSLNFPHNYNYLDMHYWHLNFLRHYYNHHKVIQKATTSKIPPSGQNLYIDRKEQPHIAFVAKMKCQPQHLGFSRTKSTTNHSKLLFVSWNV